MTAIARLPRRSRPWRQLAADRSGVALIEFAFTLPLVLGVSLYGVETASLALANLRVSQIALNLADNASRVGLSNSSNRQELREVDLTDVLTGARLQGEQLGLTTYGRITLSSLEEFNGKQYIHWQRCIGLKSGAGWDSRYGTTAIDNGIGTKTYDLDKNKIDGTEVKDGMGPDGAKVTAPESSGVMFVEIDYEYQPVVSSLWMPEGYNRIHYTASLIVRDRRIFDRVFNPAPKAAAMTCDKHTET